MTVAFNETFSFKERLPRKPKRQTLSARININCIPQPENVGAGGGFSSGGGEMQGGGGVTVAKVQSGAAHTHHHRGGTDVGDGSTSHRRRQIMTAVEEDGGEGREEEGERRGKRRERGGKWEISQLFLSRDTPPRLQNCFFFLLFFWNRSTPHLTREKKSHSLVRLFSIKLFTGKGFVIKVFIYKTKQKN